jgi:hypothetical protein
LEEGIEIKQVSHSKYLGTDGIGKDEIKKQNRTKQKQFFMFKFHMVG